MAAGSRFDGGFHVYGLEWNATHLVFFADGQAMSVLDAQCFSQDIGMDFDRETMPGWMGLPDHFVTDDPFEVDYVRSWKTVEG